jgi:excisionase family DNA binding protein
MRKREEKRLENFLDLTNAARFYPLSRRTLQTLVHNNQLQGFRVGGKIIVKRDDLERLLTASPVGADLDRMVNEVAQEVLK